MVHLGIGAFHRAHQAAYIEQVLSAGDPRWGITAASLRSADVRDRLEPQDWLYTLVERDRTDERLQVIGAVQEVIVFPEAPDRLIAALAHPDAYLVTLTVTEKGYRLNPTSGALLTDDPDVAADLVSPDRPRTVPGLLVHALSQRRAAGLAPFTAISCDNLPHNGRRLREAVVGFARLVDPGLADWIEDRAAFPQTMVDRIVPATTAADIAALTARTGVEDRAMVKTEPFTQWVIEDRFCGPRPDLEAAGVQITRSVAPWEEAKLRLLNGAHSGIAYLSGLAGIDFVHQALALPALRTFVNGLWDEAAATLTPPPGLDIAAYRTALMARFDNPTLEHRTRQIAMDGSQKLPQRLLASIAERRRRGEGVACLSLAVAAWMRWQAGATDAGERFAIEDPMAGAIASRLAGVGAPVDRVSALMAMADVFPAELAADDTLRDLLAGLLADLTEHGAMAALERLRVEQRGLNAW